MFFQINVTPKEKKPAEPRAKNDAGQVEPQDNFELVLAPFQPQTRIKLDTTVYNSVKCSLKICNPSNRNLNVTISKLPPAERSIVLSASELLVQAASDAELKISWTPQEVGSWRDTLQLTDSRRIKYDVAIIGTVHGVKKPGKARSCVLGPANTNRPVRKSSPPVAREPKKNVHTNNLSQSNMPSKRPRLNSMETFNKENVSKISWVDRDCEVQKTTSSQTSRDFSTIMDSTKFTLTPLKTRDGVPALKFSSASESDFLTGKLGIVTPEPTNLKNIRRETYNTGAIRGINTCQQQQSHEFSVIMNSTNFNFTPLKPRISEVVKQPEAEFKDNGKIAFSPQEVGIVSPEIVRVPILRRETYLTAKCVKPIDTSFAEQGENDGDGENFEDSLSPRPETQENTEEPKSSEFSVLINEMNFLTPKGRNSEQAGSFSPHGCSTGNRTRSVGGKSSPQNGSPMNLAGNGTFDLSSSKIADNSQANGTYELPASPKASRYLDSVKPTRLARSFDAVSFLDPNINREETSKNPLSGFTSTPVCLEVFSSRTEYITRTSISRASYKKNYDDSSAKEVLEADLWVKSPEEQSSSLISAFSAKKRCSSLDMINEEVASPKPVLFTNLNRTNTLPAGKLEKFTKFRRMEISPPKRYYCGVKQDSTRRVSPTKSTRIRKGKNCTEPATSFRKKIQMNCSINRGQVSIPGARIANLSLAGLSRSIAKEKSGKNEPKEMSVKLHDPTDFVTKFCNPDPFGAAMTHDPFLTSTLYYDDKWMHQQEMEFKKWLNALLTPPEHLNADVDTLRVDVGKVWQSCRNREDVALAETREAVSARYHTNKRLNTLRKAACAMFRCEEVTAALSKATVCVERGTLQIRLDRDLHRDIGLQKEILELFLSYNPLWLRIGLETVYGETIPLHSNSDLVGLTRFLISRFFSDPFIVKNHSHAGTSSLKLPTFTYHMNKFILKKFLLIVYFLDYAKRNKLIGHDPCLFHKRATNKESRAILLTFAREVLSGVGDLTKVLRTHGYVVTHKQTYLDEYDYAVKEIATDLRDGVRICRVMELITGERDLTCRCRVPAISRLQKVHNVDLAIGALLRCGYTITGDIDAKSIADGHREKTLSLLWQIIYKYQAPRFEKAAKSIQRWWRSMLWYLRIRNYLRKRRDEAASTIQRAWKCHRAIRHVNEMREERKRVWAEKDAAIRVIQLHWIRRLHMMRDRRNFIFTRKAAVRIQLWFRCRRETAPFVNELRAKRRAVETIQSRWRALKLARNEQANYLCLLDASRKIQTRWRARQTGRKDQQRFRSLKRATVLIQSRWRALRSTRTARKAYEEKLNAVKTIQCWWRGQVRLKTDRNNYLIKKRAVGAIETWLIGHKIMKIDKDRFTVKRNGVLVIQRNFRRYLQTRKHVKLFRESTQACRVIQRWWRSARIAKCYRTQKQSCLAVQRWWRGTRLTKIAVASFKSLRSAVIVVQKTWRMKKTRKQYVRMKTAISTIESRYKTVLLSRSIRRDYVTKRNAAFKLQRWWRCLQTSRKQRAEYLEYRRNIIVVQTKWRAIILARRTRLDYLGARRLILNVQATWRMIRQRRIYHTLLRTHKAARILQERWRTTVATKEVRRMYIQYRSACVVIQNRYRELRASREARASYLKKRGATIVLQKNWRTLRASREYAKQRKAALVLQARWRARSECIVARRSFLALREVTLKMQLRYRSKHEGLHIRHVYLQLRSSVLKIQRRWRANRSMKEERTRFSEYRRVAIVMQSKWRMILARRAYRKIRGTVLIIQNRWRAVNIARQTRNTYETLRRAVLCVQRRYRANKLRKTAQENYARTRSIIVWMQRSWRNKLDERMRDEASIHIQTWWKSLIAMRHCKECYENQKKAAIYLQRRYRAYKCGVTARREYRRIVDAIVKIQRAWRYEIARRRYEAWVQKCRAAVSAIEKWWRVVLREKREREAKLAQLRKQHAAATVIQSAWRGHVVRTSQCAEMKELRERAERAAKAAVPSATVAFQLRESIDTLLVCNTIGQLSMCLTNIDTLTRLSFKGCILFCELNLVDKIYETIAKSNRSIPWLDVCVRCTSILITLAKLPDTKKYVYRVEFMETLARLMTISIDHHVDLFLHLSTLLWLLTENPQYAKALTECSRTSWLLTNLYVTINKKKRKFPVANLHKSTLKEQTAQLPNSKPDWGLKHKRPRLFTTVHHAISSLMKRLRIDPTT